MYTYRAGTDWDGDMDPSPIIGDDVLIGANALLVGGVRVEDGAQIGAGATIIGDDVVIGRGAKIPPLSCVKRSVDPDSRLQRRPRIRAGMTRERTIRVFLSYAFNAVAACVHPGRDTEG